MYKLHRYVDEIRDENNIILFNRLNGKIAKIDRHLVAEYEQYTKPENFRIKNKYLIDNFFTQNADDENIADISDELVKQYDAQDTLIITIMPTEKCNFRCVYCYENYKNGKMKETTAQAIVEYIESIIDGYHALHIEWFGGEPTLALDIIEYISSRIILICKSHRKPFSAGMTTNGYLLTLDVMERLYSYRIYTYQITLDGYKQTHDKQRFLHGGGGTFDVITENIQLIQQKFRRKFLQFVIRTNLTTDILNDSLDDYLNFAENILAPKGMVNFRFRVAWIGNNSSDSRMYISSESECYKYLLSKLKGMHNIRIDNDYYGILPHGGICYAANKNAFVFGSNGVIYKCTVHFEDDLNKVGVINDNGSIIFDSQKLSVWHTRKPIPQKCYQCKTIFSCLGIGCPYNCGADSNCGPAIANQFEMVIRQYSRIMQDLVEITSL